MQVSDLVKIGLSEKQSRVYLASLSVGAESVQKIAAHAAINRATCYVMIESLIKKGLMTCFTRGKKRYFAAEPPDRLLSLFEIQKRDLAEKEKRFLKILPQLKEIYKLSGEKPKVRFFEDKEGLRAMREDFLRTKDKKIESIYSVDDLRKVFSREENKKFVKARLKKKIKVEALYTSKEGPILTRKTTSGERRFVPPTKFPFTSDITLYDNKIAIASLRKKLMGVIIESKEMTNTLRSLFKLAWENAKKYQKYKFIPRARKPRLKE